MAALEEPSSGGYLAHVIGGRLKAGSLRVLSGTALLIVLIAAADRAVGPTVSLGVLYVLPMMMAATVVPPAGTVLLAFLCSFLRYLFDVPGSPLEETLRFVFAVVGYVGAGLIVTTLIRNRELAVEHLSRIRREQDLRLEAEEQLKILVESSPAAILTMDADGRILACNRAAHALFLIPEDETLRHQSIGDFLPLLADALKFGTEDLRTAAQCQGRRRNGEIFLAHTWFSSYAAPGGRRLAAIVVDSSEEMREREEEGLRQLMRGNRIAAAAVSHEVRNFCDAIALVCSNLRAKHPMAQDEDMEGLISLVNGLERIASAELYGRVNETLGEVNLQDVLDDLRIVIEPDWLDIDGEIVWELPGEMPAVIGERHGLLQAFLNLAHNSHRAVREQAVRRLRIFVSIEEGLAAVAFEDTGPGVGDPDRLFEPFQSGADGSGLGLYTSRAVVRSYGGDLRFAPLASGTCFRVEIPVIQRGGWHWPSQSPKLSES